MSTQAHASKAPVAPWIETRVQAVVGLLLFAALLAGAVAYGIFIILPELLRDQVELIFERYNTLLPDLTSGAMPPWMWVWAGAGFFGALALAGGYVFLLATSRQRHTALFWGWLGATAALVVPPVMFLFMLPTVPKLPGGSVWWFLTAAGLTAGFFYVAWMYFRDSHGVGPLWASLLGLIRAVVFTLLAFFFMLPAVRDYKDSFSRSKVLVAFDVSGSMVYTIDDIPTDAMPLDKLPTRQDKVLAFLADEKVNFLRRLEEKNPVDAFRIARSLDPEFLHFTQDDNGLMRWEWDAWQKNPKHDQQALPGPLPPDFLRQWAKPTVDYKPADEWDEATQERYRRLQGLNDDLLKKDADYTNATNLGDSLLALLDNESKKMLQGVVIFTDGRSNEGSGTAFENLKEHALANHVPIFVVAIGEERPKVKIEITDVRVPQQIQPDDKFPAVVEVTGEGLPDQPVSVDLEVTYVRKGKDGKEEQLPIGLVESVDEKKGEAAPQRQVVPLSKTLLLHPTDQPRFDKSSPPRVEVQYLVDAAALAAASDPPVNLAQQFPNVRKWEIAETVPDAELRFRARVPRDPKEIFAGKEHVSDPAGMIVQKKPLRVLLFASAATHEYQFLQAMLVRDMTKGRVKVASYLQLPPGRTEPREGIIQDAPLLKKFPDQIDRKFAGEDEKQYDLSEYDAIVAFDPDWTQLSEDNIKLLQQWADKGGGLIYVAGPVNTFQLARPAGAGDTERFKPVLELLPVVLQDIRLAEASREAKEAWPLDFSGATPDMEFLKLQEDAPGKEPAKFLDDWKEFFGQIQPDGSVNRGFYNFYPVESAKPGAQVVARFGDPTVKLKDNTLMPYIVLSNPADPDHRVAWIGWGEMWRLRQKNEQYLERFWTKLTRYVGGLNQGKVIKRITPNFGRVFTVGQNVVMEARIDDKGGVRLNENARPKVVIKPPLVGKLTTQQQRDLEDLQKEKWMTYKPKSDGWFQVRFKPPVEGDYQMEVTVNETGDKVTHKFTVKPSNPELDDARPDFARMYEMAGYADEEVQPRMSAADYAALLQKLQRPKLEDEKETAKEDRPKLYFNLKNADLIPLCMDKTSNQRRDYSDPRPIWNVPVPFHWMPAWLAALCCVSVTLGFVVGFFAFREPRAGMKAGLLAALGFATGLVSLIGYTIGRSLGWGGWLLLAGALVLLVAPLFVPHMVDLGWYAFAALVGLLCTEWLIRKLLRLA